ncbi:MAG: hypothetical protein ACYCUV_09290 [Phycisphaerae bacterium]
MRYFSDKFSAITQHTPSPIDIFVCSASYEDRSLSVANNLDRAQVGTAVVARNEPLHETAEAHLTTLEEMFAGKFIKAKLDRSDPIRTADALYQGVFGEHAEHAQNVVVDVTTFTHEALLILIKLLSMRLEKLKTIQLIYAHAGEYSVGDPPEEKWLSKGIREVRSVIGYAGDLRPSHKTHLIILSGMECERAKKLIEEFEPTIVSLGEDDNTNVASTPHFATHRHQHDQVKVAIPGCTDFKFPCYDPLRMQEILQGLVESHPGFNTIIAAMNTKVSTIGAALYALQNEAVQLCYAQPNTYNYQRYSNPDTSFSLFEWKP